MWESVVWWVVSSLISYALQPKPKSPEAPKPAGIDEFSVPTASESSPIPVVFGTRWVTQPNVVWYGDFGQVPIKSKGKSGKK